MATLLGTSFVTALPASASTTVRLVVDSLEFGGTDANPGDGVCATEEGVCTLRAALEESNALNLPAGEVLVVVAEGLEGNIEPNGTNAAAAVNRPDWMLATPTGSPTVSSRDVGGAFYHVTAPVTIDLGNRVTINDGTYSVSEGAAFFVDGPGITFTNVSQVFGSGSSFVMGPNAAGVVIDGGETRTRASNAPGRFITYRSGSRDITLRNYTVSGFRHHATGSTVNSSQTGLLWFDSAANTTFADYTIDNVLFDYPTAGTCTATDGTGCATSLIDFRFRNAASNIRVQNFTFVNSTVQNMPGTKGVFAFPFGDGETAANNTDIRNRAVQLTDLTIADNKFLDNRRYNHGSATTDPTKYGAFIVLPYTPMAGTNVIARNEFVRAEPGVVDNTRPAGLNPYAIYHQGNRTGANNTTQANLAIVDNHFDGYAGQSTLRLYHTGQATVARNTFGSLSSSTPRGSNSALAEETGTGLVMFVNATNQSNRKINPWTPTAARTVPTPAPVCLAEVDVAARTGTANQTPRVPVYLDLFWTADRTAEAYLGTYGPFEEQTDRTLEVEVPGAGSPALARIADQTGANVPIDPDTGAVNGFVRVQTHSGGARGSGRDGDLESSQLSRVVPLTGSCAPELTVTRAQDQAPETMERDLRFVVGSSMPLRAGSLVPEAVTLTAAPTDETVDADRIAPRVVSVDEVDGSEGMQHHVVVRADDSATLDVSVDAGRVTSTTGATNSNPSSGSETSTTFVNPVRVSPRSLQLVSEADVGQVYSVDLASGAPSPTADLQVTATLDEAGWSTGVVVSTLEPSVPLGSVTSGPVTVLLAGGPVPALGSAVISHELTSEDLGYHGLVVPWVNLTLLPAGPLLAVHPRATPVDQITQR